MMYKEAWASGLEAWTIRLDESNKVHAVTEYYVGWTLHRPYQLGYG